MSLFRAGTTIAHSKETSTSEKENLDGCARRSPPVFLLAPPYIIAPGAITTEGGGCENRGGAITPDAMVFFVLLNIMTLAGLYCDVCYTIIGGGNYRVSQSKHKAELRENEHNLH